MLIKERGSSHVDGGMRNRELLLLEQKKVEGCEEMSEKCV